MAIKIDSIAIERFRTFRKLQVHGAGRVNLIVGKNNTGKSSFLEAVRILATGAALDELQKMLRDREEYATGPQAGRSSPSFRYSGLFHGYPEIAERPESLTISAVGGINPRAVSIRVGWFSRTHDDDGNIRYEEHDTDEPQGEACLEITTSVGKRIHRIDNSRLSMLSLDGRRRTDSACFLSALTVVRVPPS